VRERVSFLGAQTPEAVAAYLAASDVFLFPTEREEAAPLVLPEAMACGLPVVATRIGGITEVIGRPGTEGILVPPGDVAAVVAGVDGLLRDAGRRHAMGRAARDRVLAEYTLERMVERTVAVYETAISRLRGGIAAPLAA
jgi:glycosyltransferase involved in cell wall biosynthesis